MQENKGLKLKLRELERKYEKVLEHRAEVQVAFEEEKRVANLRMQQMKDQFEKSYRELETKCQHLQLCVRDKEERILTLSKEVSACADCEKYQQAIQKL